MARIVVRVPDPFELRAVRTFELDDPMLPEQLRPGPPILPERRLWIALLDQAARDLRGPHGCWPYHDARHWVMDEGMWIGSLRWVCEELGLNLGWLRTHLLGGGPVARRNHRWMGAKEVDRVISPGIWTGRNLKGMRQGRPRHLKSVTDRFEQAVKAGLF